MIKKGDRVRALNPEISDIESFLLKIRIYSYKHSWFWVMDVYEEFGVKLLKLQHPHKVEFFHVYEDEFKVLNET